VPASKPPQNKGKVVATPKGIHEGIQKALKWIFERMEEDPSLSRSQLIEEASRSFNLSPLDADFLYRELKQQDKS
jgi:hypothetical protein